MDNSKNESAVLDEHFIKRLLAKNRPTIARAISIVEARGATAGKLLDSIHPYIGQAYHIGVTGPPGAGKSTLTAQLAKYAREHGASIGVVAIDPSSPITNGAVLGDRVRMDEIAHDDEVFIRSMATRGMSGGLSATACEAADVLDAAGFDYVFIESVGIGQIELKIEKYVDTTVVVLVPESGDHVQAIKAGLMEIANIYVLNKSDRQGAANVLQILQSALSFHQHAGWSPQVVPSTAINGEGTAELFEQIEKHRSYLNTNSRLLEKRIVGMKSRIHDMANETVSATIWNEERERIIADAIPGLMGGKISPGRLAEEISDRILDKIKN